MAARRRPPPVGRTAPHRIERDRLGTLEVPADAFYGIHTIRAVRSLSFSGRCLGDYPAYVRALAMVKQAAARANRDARVLDGRRGAAIERACAAVIGGEHAEQFPVDVLAGGGGIGVNMNVNEVIANLANAGLGHRRGAYAPVHPTTHVNASQSTADVCHSAMRLAIVEASIDLQAMLSECVMALREKAKQLRPVMSIARTCLRDAGPVSLGTLFDGHAAGLERRRVELMRSVGALRRINLGGTAIGSSDGAPPAYRRAVLKRLRALSAQPLRLRDNLYDAAQNIDDLAAVAAQLGLLAEVLIKLAQDLRLLASGPAGGFGELILPAVQEGSSFFPGKINPAVAETLLQCCFAVLGCERTARLALERGELNLNVFEGAAGICVLDAMAMLQRGLALFAEHCVKGIVANAARCRALAAGSRFPVRV